MLAASRAVLAVAEKKKRVGERRLFRDVEAKHGDSKLKKFRGKFKAVLNSNPSWCRSPLLPSLSTPTAKVTQPSLT